MRLVLAAELLNALENSIRGQSINLEIILKNCNAVVETNEENEVSCCSLNSIISLVIVGTNINLLYLSC